jgi:hypothetical protein
MTAGIFRLGDLLAGYESQGIREFSDIFLLKAGISGYDFPLWRTRSLTIPQPRQLAGWACGEKAKKKPRRHFAQRLRQGEFFYLNPS